MNTINGVQLDPRRFAVLFSLTGHRCFPGVFNIAVCGLRGNFRALGETRGSDCRSCLRVIAAHTPEEGPVAPPTPYTVRRELGASVVYDANGGAITGPINGKAAALFAGSPELAAACARVLRAIEWSTTGDRMTPEKQADTLRAALVKAGEDR